MKDRIKNRIADFFINSKDFNGIPLRDISSEFDIDYETSIDLIKELIEDNKISIQSSTNPHFIGFRHYKKNHQLELLELAKDTKVEYKKFGDVKIAFENSEYPICLYPSQQYLTNNRNLEEYGYAYYSTKLALAEPQLKPLYFDIDVLERYYSDPRFNFDFEDYSGSIACKYDEQYNPLVRNEDNIYIKSFGVGFSSKDERVVVVFLRYLHNLSPEHQIYWKGKERKDECQMLEEYYQNTIKGEWSSSHSIFSAFLGELKCVNELCQLIFDVPLFKDAFKNEKRPKEFTFFFNPTLSNYNDFIHLLDKMISDNINKNFFKGKLELVDLIEERDGTITKQHKGTLRLLEEWLTSVFNIEGEGEISEVTKSFKKIRKERQEPAHYINENRYDVSLINKQKKTILEVYNSMRQLRNILNLHPDAKDYVYPDWLQNGKLINF